MERPVPYKGDKEYIFISYSHRDSQKVWPIISQMQKDGFRVWYDDGIDPGTEWDENIAAHVVGCGYFIAFVSENYLNSENCKDELNFARDRGKPQLLIYLEDVELPQGMAMRMGRNQAIFHNRYTESEKFYAKLYETSEIEFFNENNSVPKYESKRSVSAKKNKPKYILPLIMAIVLLAAACVYFAVGGKQNRNTDIQTGTAVEDGQNAEAEQDTGELSQMTNVVVVDNDQLKITAIKSESDSRYYTLSLSVENKAGAELRLSTNYCYINGVKCPVHWSGYIDAENTSLAEILIDRRELENINIDAENITVIELTMYGDYTDDSGDINNFTVTYFPCGEENAVYETYTIDEGDTILFENDGFVVTACESWYGEENNVWYQRLVCVNSFDEDVEFCLENDTLNGYIINEGKKITVHAGKIAYTEVEYQDISWMPIGYEKVLSFGGEIMIEWDENKDYSSFEIYPEGMDAAAVMADRPDFGEPDYDDSFTRVIYLGAYNYPGGEGDVFYVKNLRESTSVVDIFVDKGVSEYTVIFTLDPLEEAVFIAPRDTSYDETAVLSIYSDGDGGNMYGDLELELPEVR